VRLKWVVIVLFSRVTRTVVSWVNILLFVWLVHQSRPPRRMDFVVLDPPEAARHMLVHDEVGCIRTTLHFSPCRYKHEIWPIGLKPFKDSVVVVVVVALLSISSHVKTYKGIEFEEQRAAVKSSGRFSVSLEDTWQVLLNVLWPLDCKSACVHISIMLKYNFGECFLKHPRGFLCVDGRPKWRNSPFCMHKLACREADWASILWKKHCSHMSGLKLWYSLRFHLDKQTKLPVVFCAHNTFESHSPELGPRLDSDPVSVCSTASQR